jgi:hypothetical protein
LLSMPPASISADISSLAFDGQSKMVRQEGLRQIRRVGSSKLDK